METQLLDGAKFATAVRMGAMNLQNQAQAINDLNVFPIPDGDTGDNMTLTMMGGVDVVTDENESIADASRKVADGMLLSARGNSGVILPHLFDGIAEGLEGLEKADAVKVGEALQCGVQHAYSAVIEPTEGTILTVARNAAEYAASQTPKTLDEFFDYYISEAKRTLDRTPEMLPVLKKAGVVDSGGAGLIAIVEGMQKALSGDPVLTELAPIPQNPADDIDIEKFTADSELEFGYCTELLVRLQNAKTDVEAFDVSVVTDFLQTIGDSVVAFKTGTAVKIHVHTKTPDKVLAFCQQYGEFLKVKIENMTLQHNNATSEALISAAEPETERKDYGVIAVCSGEGVKQLFIDRGADYIVDGGQSMNPSTEDFLSAFDKVNADTIFVFPNNGNIVLAANQAAQLYKKSDVRVIESRTVGEGYSALSMYDTSSGDTDEIASELTDAMGGVVTACVSKSIRDAAMDGVEVHSGDYIGFKGKDILTSSETRIGAAQNTVDANLKNHDICLIIFGNEVGESEASDLEKYINEKYPSKEVYTVNGKQDIYDYILIFE